MPKRTDTKRTIPAVAGLLAWLIPGAGHVYIGRWGRGVVLFVAIHAMFWSGVLLGGVLAVDRVQQPWWCYAQFGAGASGVMSYQRQARAYGRIADEARQIMNAPGTIHGQAGSATPAVIAREQARANLGLNTENYLAYMLTGVAGLLNVMCVFDAAMLSAAGETGEPRRPRPDEKEQA